MPTYDYRCQSCHLQLEVQHAINGHGPNCPACGGQMEKVILCAPAFHGHVAQGRELAMRSLEPKPEASTHAHKPGCGCGAHH